MIEYVSDLVCEAKRTFEDCAVVVAGDFNQWPIGEIVEDHPDLSKVEHGPTRNGRNIDQTLANFGAAMVDFHTVPPLETEDGSTSDHKMAYFKAVFPQAPPETVTCTYRPYTTQGEASFINAMAAQSWETVFSADSADKKASAFQEIIDRNIDAFFPLKTTTQNTSDPPWVNNLIRRLSVKLRKIYDPEGRSTRWKMLKKKVAELYRTRAQQYVQRQKDILTGPEASKFFYKHVKAYRSREKPPDFNVCNLFPEKSKKEVAESLVDHFNAISKEFSGIPEGKMHVAHAELLPLISWAQVETQLCSFKKTGSMVEGDIFPVLVDGVAPWLSAPLTDLHNCITATQNWPSL